MKNNKPLIVGAVIVVMAAVLGGVWFLRGSASPIPSGYAPAASSSVSEAQVAPSSSSVPNPSSSAAAPAPAGDGTLSWSFSEASSTNPAEGPRTKVTLASSASGKRYEAGTFTGTCAVIEGSSWQLLPGERAGVICWWAGAGSEIGVFEENGKLILKKGDIEEGTAETDGFRGGFKTVLSID